MNKTIRTGSVLCSALCLCSAFQNAEAKEKKERPNILWLTFEDTSFYEFGCYGNDQVSTPTIDSLAAEGVLFTNAWSNAPQSSPARSSLITGCYATTYGMDFHPVAFDTPEDIFFPQILKEAGYYCVNNSKTHYNSTNDNKACWDDCSKTATYNNCPEGQPFFAVFNTATSHMGRIRTHHIDGRRDYTEEGIYPQLLTLPPHVPDLQEVRSDYAGHLEGVQDVDTWVSFFLKDLQEHGLDSSTIIFVFSDHGGCLPRGKGYLYETGLKVPMVAYFPGKWKHLAPECSPEGTYDAPMGFVDLAPSMLSLAGVKTPERMQGHALMGKYRTAPQEMHYAFAANQLHHFMPVRAVSDGKYKYIRSYLPYRQFALRNYYQWGMPSNKAWDELVLGGHNTNPAWDQPFEVHPAEMLFDLEADPWELHDIAGEPGNEEILTRFREAMSEQIRSTSDLGFFLPTTRRAHVLYDYARDAYPMEELWNLAELAGTAEAEDLPVFMKALGSPYDEFRFWGAAGIAQLATSGKLRECPVELLSLLDDTNPYVACEAAYTAVLTGHKEEGLARLVSPVKEEDRKVGYSVLECLSLHEEMIPVIKEHCLQELKDKAETLPHKENEDAGLMARGILVNLGEMDMDVLHGEESYKAGLKLNHGRRPMIPLP